MYPHRIKEYKYSNLTKLDGIYFDVFNMENIIKKISKNKSRNN